MSSYDSAIETYKYYMADASNGGSQQSFSQRDLDRVAATLVSSSKIGAMLADEVAAHSTMAAMMIPETLGPAQLDLIKERSIPASVSSARQEQSRHISIQKSCTRGNIASTNPPLFMSKFMEGEGFTSIQLPALTESEKGSALGANFCYMMGLFCELKQRIVDERSVKTKLSGTLLNREMLSNQKSDRPMYQSGQNASPNLRMQVTLNPSSVPRHMHESVTTQRYYSYEYECRGSSASQHSEDPRRRGSVTASSTQHSEDPRSRGSSASHHSEDMRRRGSSSASQHSEDPRRRGSVTASSTHHSEDPRRRGSSASASTYHSENLRRRGSATPSSTPHNEDLRPRGSSSQYSEDLRPRGSSSQHSEGDLRYASNQHATQQNISSRPSWNKATIQHHVDSLYYKNEGDMRRHHDHNTTNTTQQNVSFSETSQRSRHTSSRTAYRHTNEQINQMLGINRTSNLRQEANISSLDGSTPSHDKKKPDESDETLLQVNPSLSLSFSLHSLSFGISKSSDDSSSDSSVGSDLQELKALQPLERKRPRALDEEENFNYEVAAATSKRNKTDQC